MEDLFIKMLRAANILTFFGAIIAGVVMSKGMPAGVSLLMMLGSFVGAGIWCGGIALFMRMGDRLEEQTKLLETIAKQGRSMPPRPETTGL